MTTPTPRHGAEPPGVCRDCQYCDHEEDENGQPTNMGRCHYWPPLGGSNWPQVSCDTGWCGQFLAHVVTP